MFRSKILIVARVLFYSALVVGCALAFSPGGNALHAHMNDKIMHAAGFFVMMTLSHWAHPAVAKRWLVLGLACFGMFIEVVQAYLPYRSFSIMDWVADVIGIAMYLVFIFPPMAQIFARHRYGLD